MNTGAIIISRQNRMMLRFATAKATKPESAETLDSLGIRRTFVFERMVARGVFVETDDGQFYMDTSAAADFCVHRRNKILIFLGTGLVIMLIVWWIAASR